MGRTKTYDRNEVIERAMHEFWAKGYSATSVRDLVAACEIVPSSLYLEFGDKVALFLTVLDRYIEQQEACYAEVLGAAPYGLDRIAAHFDRYSYGRSFRGCLLVNALGGGAQLPASAVDTIDAFFERIRALFEAQLEPSVGGARAESLSRVLLTFDIGLATTGKLPSQREHLRRALGSLLSTLARAPSASRERRR